MQALAHVIPGVGHFTDVTRRAVMIREALGVLEDHIVAIPLLVVPFAVIWQIWRLDIVVE